MEQGVKLCGLRNAESPVLEARLGENRGRLMGRVGQNAGGDRRRGWNQNDAARQRMQISYTTSGERKKRREI